MRLYIPELEILLDDVRCDCLVFGKDTYPCMIVDFRFNKYPSSIISVHTVEVSLKRAEGVFAFDCYFTSKPLKDIRLESKRSEQYSAIVKMRDLPFQGFRLDDKLFFAVEYYVESEGKRKQKAITFILKETGWELYGNTCDKIKNAHYTITTLPIIREDDCTVTLTGIAYDFEKTYYYFSVANFTDGQIVLYAYEQVIAVLMGGKASLYKNEDYMMLVEVEAKSTGIGILELENRPTDDIDFDLMSELNENSFNCKATASICVSIDTEKEDDAYVSDWIVGEIGMIPGMPTIKDSHFEYEDQPTTHPLNNSLSPVLSYKDFIIYSHAFHCLNNHKTEMINAVVKIALYNGEIAEKKVSAAYCATCNKYIILDSDYERLKSYGVLLCRQQSYDVFVKSNDSFSGFRDWKRESDLKLLGYTVNAKDNLSDIQRQTILRAAIDSGIYTTESLRSFLMLLVENREGNPSYYSAIQKWKRDIDYVSQYGSSVRRNVGVNSVSKTNYKNRGW